MAAWEPGDHHTTIVNWARRHSAPIITVNFDENRFVNVIDYFRNVTGVNVYTDWSALGVEEDARPAALDLGVDAAVADDGFDVVPEPSLHLRLDFSALDADVGVAHDDCVCSGRSHRWA